MVAVVSPESMDGTAEVDDNRERDSKDANCERSSEGSVVNTEYLVKFCAENGIPHRLLDLGRLKKGEPVKDFVVRDWGFAEKDCEGVREEDCVLVFVLCFATEKPWRDRKV